MGEILVGTASWTDKTLIESGRFYPREAKSAEARLRYYATQFPLVEIDSTYYALPAEQTAPARRGGCMSCSTTVTGTRRSATPPSSAGSSPLLDAGDEGR